MVGGVGVVIMAAGLGKRMRSKQSKVLHAVAGQPMVLYAVNLARCVAGQPIAVVVGHQGELVQKVVEGALEGSGSAGSVHIVKQEQQLGTGHAVLQTRPVFAAVGRRAPSHYLILNGDTPLLRESTVRELLRVHQTEGAAITMLTAVLEDPSGYGRVVRHRSHAVAAGSSVTGAVLKIVEDRDASAEERAIAEINVGTYVVDGNFLFPALEKIEPHNAQGEYYLTDIVDMAVAQGHRVVAVPLKAAEEGLGVNTREQLAEAERVVRQQIRHRWLEDGVTMLDPASTWIDADVMIGKDTVLFPNVMLEGKTIIGQDCVVRSSSRLTDCVVGDGVEILDHCVLRESQIDDQASVGPFTHLRPGVRVRRKAKVGNFVEMKKTDLGEGSKANHLSYLGDAKIGRGVNIGAGTITCNYDGVRKHETVIRDNVFIGSDTQLVAPVTVGTGSVIAAGTTVTQDVPNDALVIARVAQMNKTGWAAKRRALQAADIPREGKKPKTKGKR
jgi:bifunctional UDP-N-acetylglucosamine pyrophosphorylase/glucosamine-1-phosphate N-acetyltransferase